MKQKKLYFGQKSKSIVYFEFNLNLSSFEFIEFFRFFEKKPLNINKSFLENSMVINRKLKQFDFNKKLSFFPKRLSNSFIYIKSYHLD